MFKLRFQQCNLKASVHNILQLWRRRVSEVPRPTRAQLQSLGSVSADVDVALLHQQTYVANQGTFAAAKGYERRRETVLFAKRRIDESRRNESAGMRF